jgi:hypothetical protein
MDGNTARRREATSSNKTLFGNLKGRNSFGNRHKWDDNIKTGVKSTEL